MILSKSIEPQGSIVFLINSRRAGPEPKAHSDLPPTTLRGYVQLSTAVVPGAHIALNHNGTPYLKGDGTQAYGVDAPHYLGPAIVATRDVPVRIEFYNLLPTGSGGDLFIPVDTTVMGASLMLTLFFKRTPPGPGGQHQAHPIPATSGILTSTACWYGLSVPGSGAQGLPFPHSECRR